LPAVAAAAPATTLAVAPTFLLCCLRRLTDGSRTPTPEGSRPGFPWGDVALSLNPCPAHYEPAFASSLILYPQPHRLALRFAFPRGGGLRAYHVASLKPCGLGPASTPVARHLRRVSSEHPGLATHLLAQAYQHLWLVLCDDACGGSPGLTVPRPPGPQPPWCWQSQLWLAPGLPSGGMRVRCPEGFAPPRCQGRTPR
jgi:hypothetical protein